MRKMTTVVLVIGAFLLGNYLTGIPIWKAILKKVGLS